MLLKWLKEIPSPTWGKLDDAINLTRSSSIRIVSDDFHYVRGELYQNTIVSNIIHVSLQKVKCFHPT